MAIAPLVLLGAFGSFFPSNLIPVLLAFSEDVSINLKKKLLCEKVEKF